MQPVSTPNIGILINLLNVLHNIITCPDNQKVPNNSTILIPHGHGRQNAKCLSPIAKVLSILGRPTK